MPEASLDQHIAAARKRLALLGGVAAHTAQTEATILKAARARLAAVDTDLAKLRPRAIAETEAGDRYTALTTERGQLVTTIARSRQVLRS